MTTAICIYCGNPKFGAFVPCQQCDQIPTSRSDVVRSLILTDHHFTFDELRTFGEQIKAGTAPTIDPNLERSVSAEIDDAAIEKLVRMSDPVYREYCRRSERTIILLIMAAMIGAIAWMLYRFALG